MKYRYLKQNVLGRCCRRCVNKEYHLKLVPQDCVYMEYKYKCEKCGDVQNIVYDIRKASRYKILFGHR